MSIEQHIGFQDAGAATRPVPTLLGARYGDLDDLNRDSLALAGVFCDHYCEGSVGGRFAPRQLRYAQWPALGFVPSAPVQWRDVGDLNVYPLQWQKNADAMERQASALASKGARSLFVSGDYSNTPALLRGSLRKVDERVRGFVRIARRLDLQVNHRQRKPTPRSAATLEVMDSLAPGPSSVLMLLSSPDQVEAEVKAMRSLGLAAHVPGIPTANSFADLEQAIRQLRARCKGVYLSLDADAVIDPVTGTAWPPLNAVLDSLAQLPLLAGDLTGFVPTFGIEGRVQANRVLGVLHSLATTITGSPR